MSLSWNINVKVSVVCRNMSCQHFILVTVPLFLQTGSVLKATSDCHTLIMDKSSYTPTYKKKTTKKQKTELYLLISGVNGLSHVKLCLRLKAIFKCRSAGFTGQLTAESRHSHKCFNLLVLIGHPGWTSSRLTQLSLSIACEAGTQQSSMFWLPFRWKWSCTRTSSELGSHVSGDFSLHFLSIRRSPRDFIVWLSGATFIIHARQAILAPVNDPGNIKCIASCAPQEFFQTKRCQRAGV